VNPYFARLEVAFCHGEPVTCFPIAVERPGDAADRAPGGAIGDEMHPDDAVAGFVGALQAAGGELNEKQVALFDRLFVAAAGDLDGVEGGRAFEPGHPERVRERHIRSRNDFIPGVTEAVAWKVPPVERVVEGDSRRRKLRANALVEEFPERLRSGRVGRRRFVGGLEFIALNLLSVHLELMDGAFVGEGLAAAVAPADQREIAPVNRCFPGRDGDCALGLSRRQEGDADGLFGSGPTDSDPDRRIGGVTRPIVGFCLSEHGMG